MYLESPIAPFDIFPYLVCSSNICQLWLGANLPSLSGLISLVDMIMPIVSFKSLVARYFS